MTLRLRTQWSLIAGSAVLAALSPNGAAYAEPQTALRGRLAETVRSQTCVVDQKTCMRLLGVTIDGARATPAAELTDIYQPYLTQPVDVGDIAAIALAITERYRASGYVLSQAVAPEQDFSSGVARILVIEGEIDDVRIQGDGKAAVETILGPLASRAPANLAAIDRALALAEDIPGLDVTSRIEPDATDAARHKLVVEADIERFEGYAEVSNRGAADVGPWQVYTSLAANSLWTPRDQLSLGLFSAADPDEFVQIDAGYRLMFPDGGRLVAHGSVAEAGDGPEPTTPDPGGGAATATLGYEFPLVRGRSKGLWLGGLISGYHLESDWLGGGGYRDELRVGRVALRGYQEERGSAAYISVRASFGLDLLGASGFSAVNRSRADADAVFYKLDVHASYYRDLGPYFGVYASIDGQWADGPLLQSEEFSVGGPRLGRAYGYGEMLGDDALAAVVELRGGFDPDLEHVSFLQGYVFYDVAEVRNDRRNSEALSSAGLGFRVDVDDWLSARLEVAKPLTRTPAETSDRDWRNFFSLAAEY